MCLLVGKVDENENKTNFSHRFSGNPKYGIDNNNKSIPSQTDDTSEMDEAVYLPTPRIEQFAQAFRKYGDGEIDKVETY